MKKIKMIVSGRVQGVGFRFTTKMVADRLGVKGYVKNLDDGSVYIEAIADDIVLENFINKIKASPSPSGRVTYSKIVEDDTIEERRNFDVLY
ncbi:acylphosphatase [Vagococcus elongatus]|uniref:acylphosphatase n=1 Tax=Vagococcus elongatus TaxID=180344 RepID=A0A430AX74_9ENTE|nr:acylphosphatase [Vagococcus elongatus]RSU12671.1 acylphosphatase [Vagococcus elongatus]